MSPSMTISAGLRTPAGADGSDGELLFEEEEGLLGLRAFRERVDVVESRPDVQIEDDRPSIGTPTSRMLTTGRRITTAW